MATKEDALRTIRLMGEHVIPKIDTDPEHRTSKMRAAAAGAGDRDALVLETLIAFKRAGCSGILTYHAAHAARLLIDG